MLGQAYTIAKSCLVPNKYYAILTVLRYGQMEASELVSIPKLYIPSTPNNSNETHTFMCLGRTGRFGQR